MPKYTSPAIVQAVSTRDLAGFPAKPEVVAHALQRHLNALLEQGYEVLSVLTIPDGVLSVALKRPEPPGVRWYGCEGLTCGVGSHTLDCPNIDKPG